ncbi:MAG: hypothetical protein ACLFQV_10905 [Vulcanimicrobiota bacterium]
MVFETREGTTVAAMNPKAVSMAFDNPDLEKIADSVKNIMEKVIMQL